MSHRASIFDDDPDFDVSDFAPRKEAGGGQAPAEMIRAVSEASSFPSREALPAAARVRTKEPAARQERTIRRYRTGRNVQLNIKVRAQTMEAFYAVADQQGWVLGETLDRAIAALNKELAAASD